MSKTKTLADSLDTQRLIQDSLDLVNVDSPTGREGEVGEALCIETPRSGHEGDPAGSGTGKIQRSWRPCRERIQKERC